MTTIEMPSTTRPNYQRLIVGIAAVVVAATILVTVLLVNRGSTSSAPTRAHSVPAERQVVHPNPGTFTGTANSTADNPSNASSADCQFRYLHAVC